MSHRGTNPHNDGMPMYDYPVSRTFREYEAEYYDGITLSPLQENPQDYDQSRGFLELGMKLGLGHIRNSTPQRKKDWRKEGGYF